MPSFHPSVVLVTFKSQIFFLNSPPHHFLLSLRTSSFPSDTDISGGFSELWTPPLPPARLFIVTIVLLHPTLCESSTWNTPSSSNFPLSVGTSLLTSTGTTARSLVLAFRNSCFHLSFALCNDPLPPETSVLMRRACSFLRFHVSLDSLETST